MILHIDTLADHQVELENMLKEDNDLAIWETEIKIRRDEIKRRVKELATFLGGEEQRVVLPGGVHGAWDRIISRTGAGIDLSKLEEILGQEAYRKLVCIRQVIYTPVPEKVEVARVEGKITEDVLNRAYNPGKIMHSLKKLRVEQVDTLREKERCEC